MDYTRTMTLYDLEVNAQWNPVPRGQVGQVTQTTS